jgi:ADP-ribosylation factor protein 1
MDSNDVDRLAENRDQLHSLLTDPVLRDVPVLVWANKQDLPYAVKPSDVTEQLGMNGVRDREWFVQGCQATNGAGLMEGLEWMAKTLRKRV